MEKLEAADFRKWIELEELINIFLESFIKQLEETEKDSVQQLKVCIIEFILFKTENKFNPLVNMLATGSAFLVIMEMLRTLACKLTEENPHSL